MRTMNGAKGLHCPHCGSPKITTAETRSAKGYIRRRRKCLSCQQTFATHERIAAKRAKPVIEMRAAGSTAMNGLPVQGPEKLDTLRIGFVAVIDAALHPMPEE